MNASEKQNIEKFIKCISEKNFAEGNKYLKTVVEEKLKARIANAVKKLS
jgi:hypothetical protein